MPTKSYNGCQKGTYMAYLERTDNIPKYMDTEEASRYILKHPHKFQNVTIRRATLFLNTMKARRRSGR